jgi:hypothetical protein
MVTGLISIVLTTRKIEYMIITSDRNYAVACFVVKVQTILFNFALNLIERCYIINIRVMKY